jgi:hypothetical protein
LRNTAITTAYLGAIISVGSVLYAGRTNSHWVLTCIFVVWVSSPFVMLLAADAAFGGKQTLLHIVTIVIAIASIAIYVIRIVSPPKAQAAFPFVVTPPVSWVIIAVAVLMARRTKAGL